MPDFFAGFYIGYFKFLGVNQNFLNFISIIGFIQNNNRIIFITFLNDDILIRS